jgi:Xaa-Pro dipeptidase
MIFNETRARQMMREQNLGALIGSTLENVYYVSGLWSQNFIVTPRHAQLFAIVAADRLATPYIVAGQGDAAGIVQSCPNTAGVFLHGTFYRTVNQGTTLTDLDLGVKRLTVDQPAASSPLAALILALKTAGLEKERIAIDERGLAPGFLDELKAHLPKAQFEPGDMLLRKIRSVKTPEEISLLKKAMEIAEGAIQEFFSNAREGMTEEEAVRIFDAYVTSHGARPKFTMIYFGNHSAIGQISRLDGVLRKGEVGRLDVGCVYQGYNSDLARSYSLGEPNARARSYYQATLVGQEQAIASMRPGVRANAVFTVGVETVRAHGIPHFQRHHVGHAIGLEVYDLPVLNASDNTVLEEGMVFEVELPYYELGLGGIQPEDTVLVTKDGAKILTTLPRDFKVL